MTRCLECMSEYKEEYGICPYCGYEPGAAVESALHMQPGSILEDRYLIGKVVGSGGFGVTYIAWDYSLQQRAAIKEYLPIRLATRAVGQTQVFIFGGNKAEQFADGMAKFVEEAKRRAQFPNEPGIVRVFDSFEANNTAYIVMEFLDGETLTSYLEREGKVPVEQAIEMLTPVIQSLEVLHKTGVIFRNIAPDNIILNKDKKAKLIIDFGTVYFFSARKDKAVGTICYPSFAPPEQYETVNHQDPRTDIYALGATLYYAMTGIKPEESTNRKIDDTLMEPAIVDSGIPRSVSATIMRAMALEKKHRFPNVKEFEKALLIKDNEKIRHRIWNIFLHHKEKR